MIEKWYSIGTYKFVLWSVSSDKCKNQRHSQRKAENKPTIQKPKGATHCKMGYMYVWPWRPPFHSLLAIFTRRPFQHFWILKTPLFTQKHKFLEISSSKAREFSSKDSNWAKIQFTWLHFVKEFSSWCS